MVSKQWQLGNTAEHYPILNIPGYWTNWIRCPGHIPSKPFTHPNLIAEEGRVGNREDLTAMQSHLSNNALAYYQYWLATNKNSYAGYYGEG